jgi:hypothetical protein
LGIALKYVHSYGVSHIDGKFQQGLHLCFKTHFNQRSAKEVMAIQCAKSPNFGSFGTPNLGISGQHDI